MKDLPLGGSTTCRRESLEPHALDEWLIRTVMALYTEACTIVRTDARLSESFEVKVGLHQGSVLSPLLFAAVMDVVSCCHGCCFQRGEKWSAFRVAVC